MSARRLSTTSTGSTLLENLFLAVSQEHERIMKESPEPDHRESHSPLLSSSDNPSPPSTSAPPKSQRGARPSTTSTTNLPLQVKKQGKMEGNRQAAQRCRQRKKIYITALEMRVAELEKLNALIEIEIKRIHRLDGSPSTEQPAPSED
jgi:hypothetical protein